MPTAQEKLWDAVKNNQFDTADTIIKEEKNVDLVNETDKNKNSLLIALLSKPNKPMNLIKTIITHSKFNPLYCNPISTQSNVGAVIATGCLEIFQLFFQLFPKNTGILTDNTQLAFITASGKLRIATKNWQKNTESEELKLRKDNLTQIVVILRDATIRHAIATDDTELLNTLDTEGGKPTEALSDGKLPSTLAANAPLVNAWLASHSVQAPAPSPVAAPASSGGFFGRLLGLQTQEAALTAAYNDKKLAIIANAATATDAQLQQARGVLVAGMK